MHGGIRRSQYGEVAEPIFLTQGFVYESAEQAAQRFEEAGEDEFIYSRYGNPTVRMFEERIAEIEGAEDAFATASGMAAVYASLASMLKTGDHVVSARALFGSCHYILEEVLQRFGVDVTFVDGTSLDAWKVAVRPDTKAVFLESVSNPTLEVIDIKAVAAIAHEVGATVIVDNVFSTPVLSRVLDLGADIVVYSATKHIDGQGRVLGGVVLGTRDYVRKTLEPFLKHTGGAMSPFTAWLLLKGMETLDLRVRVQAESARKVAETFEGHARLERVIYPGLKSHPQHEIAMAQMKRGGTVATFVLKGGQEAAFRFLNSLQIFIISNNLGDAKSIVTHPTTTTHQRLTDEQRDELGILPGLVRLSMGLEDVDDLIGDIRQALEAA